MEAYKIWASLNLKGDAIKKMAIFAEEVRKANYNISLLNVNLEKFTRHLALSAPAFVTFSKTFAAINTQATLGSTKFSKYQTSLNNTSLSTDKLAASTSLLNERLRETSIVSAEAAASAKMSTAGMAAAAGAGAARMGGRKSGKRIAYAGGHIAGAPHYAMGVGALGGMGGMGALIGGYAAYSSLKHGFAADTEMQQSMMQLKAQGFSSEGMKIAEDFSKTPIKGVSRNELLKSFVDSVMITKELPGTGYEHSKELAALLAKAQFAATATFGKMSDSKVMDMARAAEIWGGSDHKKVMEGTNLMFQMMSSSAGTVDPTQLQQFLAQGAGAFGNLTPMGFIGLEPVIQELKGRRAATGLVTLGMQFGGGAGTLNNKRRVKDLLKLGIYESASFDRSGRPTSTHVKREFGDLLATDPFLLQESIIKKYKAAGTTDPIDIKQRLELDFGHTPSQELFLMYKNRDKIMRQRQMARGFWGVGKSYVEALDINAGVSTRFNAASHNLAIAFGELTAPATIKSINMLSSILEGLAKVFNFFTTMEKGTPFEVEMKDLEHKRNQKILNFFGLGDKKDAGSFISDKKSSDGGKNVGHVYIDSHKAGKVIFGSFSDTHMRSGVIGGTSGFNHLMAPISSAMFNIGSP